jgi:hypothetical protein
MTAIVRKALESAYVLTVAVIATCGFAGPGSTAAILTAAALALPTSIVAVPGFYMAYGLLAQFPGANPSSSTSFGGCSPEGDCYEHTTGDVAPWFVVTTDVIGVLALTAAALLNVVLLRMLTRRRMPVDDDFAGTPHRW